MAADGEHLARATIRAGKLLGLTNASLARAIGVSEPVFEQMARGEHGLSPVTKTGEIALLLVSVSQSLDRLAGRDNDLRLAWMHQHNHALGGVPAKLVERLDGLVSTLHFLDGVRAGHFLLVTS